MKIAIIDYGSGNLHSVQHSVAFAAAQHPGADVKTVSDADALMGCDYIILPGVGHFADCWSGLNKIDGMTGALEEMVLARARPFLGICVGMQLLADHGHEGGQATPGLGWIRGQVRHFSDAFGKTGTTPLKVPHMGWNQLTVHERNHPVSAALEEQVHMYFVHSYVFETEDKAHIFASCDYGVQVPALIGRDNLLGTQFHPEKSQRAGQQLLDAFLSWQP